MSLDERARQMEGQEGAHHRPAQSGAINDGIINLFCGGDAIIDQMERLNWKKELQKARRRRSRPRWPCKRRLDYYM